MQVEITAAINLIAANLYNKLPRRRVDAFAEELEKGIVAKFQGHWYPENPTKGAAYRCINVSGDKVDPVIIYSVINSGEAFLYSPIYLRGRLHAVAAVFMKECQNMFLVLGSLISARIYMDYSDTEAAAS